ncbi:zinc-dependent alcohol dehydrogenase family protein [Pseudarthrobacter sp. NIBRBAC000502772]|uniref:zinc-dependent alcohol dehydrogenase family protein n=1 Tax=Pseudarthrobacter sp. NIBRBAC000502772 TaxID=2590775 RepID=UPI0011308933|nr:zinc-dependent alcohol dehydrogenase family protein [Pseudarthrobacter sp. NIBRBAC000502772]QDG66778.1 zinc-dependent alcohol dehydrogenase family protein [Pseudarthrobacter sp. NIBRBAC000502772]
MLSGSLTATMKAVVFDEGSSWSLEQISIPVPGRGEVLLRPIRVGVCGTDEHLLHGGFIAKFPLIPGHEIVAEVAAYGDGTTGPAVGSEVVVDPTVFCGDCPSCKRGQPGYCASFGSLGCDRSGGFADYMIASASKIFPTGGLHADIAVLTEPTACALHGVDVLALKPASDVLIFGAGPTGLILAQLLRMAGAARVTVAAPTASKLAVALKQGANHAVQIDRANPDAAAEELRRIAPEGFDAVVEATGSTSVLELGLSLTRNGGTVLVYGLAGENALAAVKPYEVFSRELTIKGSFAQANCIGRALFALQSGQISTAGIVTSVVNLDQFQTALDNLHDSEQIKSVVIPTRP